MRNAIFPGLLILLCAILSGCGPDQGSGIGITVDSTQADGAVKYCGKPELIDVQGDKGWPVGTFEVQNDTQFLWINFAPISGRPTANISLYVGEASECPRLATGEMDYAAFKIQARDHSLANPWAARIPLRQLPVCLMVAGRFEVRSAQSAAVGELGMDKGSGVATGLQYCIQACGASSIDCDLSDVARRPATIQQTDWGGDKREELGRWLADDFGAVYPQGMILGCEKTVTVGSGAEVLESLPMDGPATSLAATVKGLHRQAGGNQLLGELVCLELALKMDEKAAKGNKAKASLAMLVVAGGAFEGWTLEDLRNEANSVLGACTSNYTAPQICEMLHAVNAALAGPDGGDGILRCP